MKNKAGAPIYKGMLVTRLAWSYGVFDAPKVRFLMEVHGHPLQPRLFKTACIVLDLGGSNYVVPDDDPIKIPRGQRNVR